MRARLRDRLCFVAADGRAALRVRSFVVLCRRSSNCAIGCGFVSADGRAALLV